MAKIYVSPETLKKLPASDDYSKVLKHFDINRPEPKKRQPKYSNHKSTSASPKSFRQESPLNTTFQKTLNRVETEESESYFDNTFKFLKQASRQNPKQKTTKPKKNNDLQKSFNSLKKTIRQIKRRHHIDLHNTTKSPKKKKKFTTKPLMGDIPKRKRSRIVSQPVTFFYAPKRSNPRSSSSKSSGKKTPISSKYMFDHSSPASEYESRQVEFGHGRAKSKEWNDEIARKFQKELKGHHRKKDWTDRFALK